MRIIKSMTEHEVSINGTGQARDGMQQANGRNAIHKINYTEFIEINTWKLPTS